jgi:AsmA protein
LLFISSILVFLLPKLINANNYKTYVTAMIKEKIGRDVVFEGDIVVSVFPQLGVSAEKIVVSNAPGFQELPFITVEKSDININLVPLLTKKIEISSIDLDGLTLNLAKDKQDIGNWSDLIVNDSKINAKQDDSKFKSQFGFAGFDIGGINVLNTSINWDNQQTGEHLELKNIQFNANKFVFDKQLKIDISMDVSGSVVTFPVSIKCVTGLLVDEKLDNFVFSDSQLDGFFSKISANGQRLAATVTISNARASIERQTLQLSDLQFQSGEFKLTAEMAGEKLIDKPSIQGFANIEAFNLKNAMKQWDIVFPRLNDANAMTNLGMSFHFQANSGQAEFANLDFVMDNSHGKGFFKINDYSRPKISFDLDVDSVDVGRYSVPEDKSTMQGSSAVLAASSFTVPLDWLRKVDAAGNLRLGKLISNQVIMQDLRLTLSSKNGIVKINQ